MTKDLLLCVEAHIRSRNCDIFVLIKKKFHREQTLKCSYKINKKTQRNEIDVKYGMCRCVCVCVEMFTVTFVFVVFAYECVMMT